MKALALYHIENEISRAKLAEETAEAEESTVIIESSEPNGDDADANASQNSNTVGEENRVSPKRPPSIRKTKSLLSRLGLDFTTSAKPEEEKSPYDILKITGDDRIIVQVCVISVVIVEINSETTVSIYL